MTKQTLFILWGILFALCAGLGFAPYTGFLTTAAAVIFFAPPAMLLYRARQESDDRTRLLIRNLSALSLGLTVTLLMANFLTALSSEALGTAVHCLLVVISTPMICSGHWALSLFLWACLLMGSLKKR